MGRVFGLILVSVGGLLLTLGVVVIVAFLFPPRGAATVGAVLAAVGLILLGVGVIVLRRTKPLGTVTTNVGRFQPGVPVTGQLNDCSFVTLYSPPVKGKHARPSTLWVSVPAPELPAFRVAGETKFDRFAKRVGLATEIDTGDAEFDAECYVTTDAAGFVAAYLADPLKRIGILDLRRQGFAELESKAGHLTAAWAGFDPLAHDRPDLEAEVAARLAVLADELPDAAAERTTGTGRRVWSWVLGVALAGYAVTVVAAFRYPPLRGWELAVRVVGGLAVLIPLFAVLSALLLRGSSSSHRAWAGLMVGALSMLPPGTVGTLSLLNATLDPAPPVVHEAVVVGKTARKAKNNTNHFVQCRAWRPDADTEEFGVSQFEYDRVVPNRSKMVVTTRAGWCGMEWVAAKRLEVK